MHTYEMLYSEDKRNTLKNIPDLSSYVGRGEKMFFTDAQEYIRALRECERGHKNIS